MLIPPSRFRRLPTIGGVRVQFSPQVIPYREELERLADRSRPEWVKYNDRFSRLPKDTFRWRISTNTLAKIVPVAVQRSHLKARYKEAFRQALKRRGLSVDGSLRARSVQGPAAVPLVGTLELVAISRTSLEGEIEKLVEQAGSIIDAVRKEMSNHQVNNAREPTHFVRLPLERFKDGETN